MNFFKIIVLVLNVILTYLKNKKDARQMRAKMLKTVDTAFQNFANDVATGDEDEVSKKISGLLDEVTLSGGK